MTRTGPGEWDRRRSTTTVALGVAAGLSASAAFSTPFTTGADTVCAIALGLVTLEGAARWRRPALSVAAPPTGPARGRDDVRLRWWPWVALVSALVCFELVNFFLGPRVDHPTVSSLYDSAAAWRPFIGACFFGWLCLGAALVRS